MKILNSINFENTQEEQYFNNEIAKIEAQEAISVEYSKLLTDRLMILLQKLESVNKRKLVERIKEIIIILNRLTFKNFSNILNFFDKQHLGLSINYVMTARNENSGNSNNQKYIDKSQLLFRNNSSSTKLITDQEADIFYQRLIILERNRILRYVFAPNRTRLVRELLKDDSDEDDEDIGVFINSSDKYNNLINKDFHQWIQNSYSEEYARSLEEKIDLYIESKEKTKLDVILVPKYLKEDDFLFLINELIKEIDNSQEDHDEDIN